MDKTTSLAGVTAAFCFLLIGCAGSPHEPTEKYVLVASSTKISYWQAAASGLNHAAAEMKVKAVVAGPDGYDPKAEHTEFQRIIQQKPTGIMVAVTDEKLLAPDIEAALKQNIPVITIDSDTTETKRLLFIGTDNYNAGKLGGQLLMKSLSGKGNVVVFTYAGQRNLEERLAGYRSVVDAGSGIKITQVVDIKGDPTVAFDTAKQLIDSKAKVDAFVCLEALACPESRRGCKPGESYGQGNGPGNGYRSANSFMDSKRCDFGHYRAETIHNGLFRGKTCWMTCTTILHRR